MLVLSLVARNSRLKLALRFAFQTLRFETRVSGCVSFCVSRNVACDPCVSGIMWDSMDRAFHVLRFILRFTECRMRSLRFSYAFQKRV